MSGTPRRSPSFANKSWPHKVSGSNVMVISGLYMLGINRNVLKIEKREGKRLGCISTIKNRKKFTCGGEGEIWFVYTPSLKIHFFSNSNLYKMYNTVSATAGSHVEQHMWYMEKLIGKEKERLKSVFSADINTNYQGWGAGAGRSRVFLAPWSRSRSRSRLGKK